MAVANFQSITSYRDYAHTSRIAITKNIQVPKKASDLKHWYKACRKVIPQMPEWCDSFYALAEIDYNLIYLEGVYADTDGDVVNWVLNIARRHTLS